MKKLIFLVCTIFVLIILTGCGKKYTCKEGKLDGNKCLVTEEVASNKSCEYGFELENDLCKKVESVDAKKGTTCDTGYTLSDGKCYSNDTFNMTSTTGCKDKAYALKYTKDKGMTTKEGEPITRVWVKQVGNKCEYWYDFGSAELNWVENTVTNKVCPSGTTKVGTTCKKTSKTITTYSCDDGYILNTDNKCVKNIIENPIHSCDSEYKLNINKCEKTVTKEAIEK